VIVKQFSRTVPWWVLWRGGASP